jgi:hyperosmotically inducible periplasmic protein
MPNPYEPVSNISNIESSDMRAVVQIGLVVALATTITPFSVFAQNGNSSEPVASVDAASALNPKAVKAANRALAKSVRTAMAKAKGIDMTHVFVYAKGGVVTLSGVVPKSNQVDRAGEIAKSVTGVSSVDNRLGVYAIER